MIGRSKSSASTLLIFLAILLLSFAVWGQANSTQVPVVSGHTPGSVQLQLNQSVHHRIPGGQSDFYVVTLKAGQFVRFAMSPPAVAAVIRFFSPGNEKLVELNLPLQGRSQEPLCWVAKTSGEYRLEISVSGEALSAYEYEIRLAELRAAVADDQNRISAQQLFEQARGLTANSEYAGVVEMLERALVLSRGVKDREREAAALRGIGAAYAGLDQYEKAIDYDEQALALAREIKDRQSEGNTLNKLGMAYSHLSQFEKAIDYDEQALAIAREIKNRQSEGNALNNLGVAYDSLSKYEKAIDYDQQALAIGREIKDRQTEAKTLAHLGAVYSDMGQYEKAIDYEEQALAIAREVKDRQREGITLSNLGSAYLYLSKYEKAIGYYEQALAIVHEIKSREGEASILNDLSIVYYSLKQYEKAIGYYEQALAIAREIKDHQKEENALDNLGNAYSAMRQYEKAIGYYEHALAIAREIKDRQGEGAVLANLGEVYSKLRQYEKAIGYYEQALVIMREVKDRQSEGIVLSEIGDSYSGMGTYEKAIGHYEQALTIEREVKDRSTEAGSLDGLMEAWKGRNKPRMAVFYGKQAVNTVQSIRSDIHGLDPELQESFLNGNEKPYHTLADLLITQGRLTEAEQVLNLLKEEEYFDFVRRESSESSSLTRHADLTPDEAAWEKRYREIGDQLVALGTERGELLNKKSLTPEETKRLAQLDQDLAAGNAAFEKFLGELAEHFSITAEATAKIEQLREAQGIMEDLRELPKGTVAIYTLVGEDKYRSILVTPDVQKAYEYPIKAADLNRKVLGFRQATENPKLDPRPLGQELYKILVANLAEDLRQAKATTVMWSLDGALRYLPVAALFDGKRYLVEQYALSVFTPASNARLKDRPDRNWTAAGFGVTKAHEGASALPDVAIELNGIISQKPGQGILQGEVKLDDQFTEEAMRQTLLKHYPVVHIASHFRFQPGNETDSFLLLGDGNHLSLAELKNLPNLFGGVQLLTLSACNTGLGDTNGDGKEVEGLGVLAQRKGAKAVVASLWSVADVSTSLLMQEFYRTRKSSTITKVEALREAQLALLRGTVMSSQNAPAKRELLHEEVVKVGQPEASSFVVDPKTPYAHPYYWAPFFLMGNWL
jgi:CHAT domain-containing protein/tetratricopeptide (TPR) repeat protein